MDKKKIKTKQNYEQMQSHCYMVGDARVGKNPYFVC